MPDQVSDRLTQCYAHIGAALREAPAPGFVASYTSTSVNPLSRDIVGAAGLPYLACGLDRAVSGIGGALWWSERRRQLTDQRAGAEVLPGGERPNSERATLAHLAAFGVPVVPQHLATSEDDAAAAAARMGGPVVLKLASAGIAHKSDIGGVALNLLGEADVRRAYRELITAARTHAPEATLEGMLVAPMRGRGIELLIGCSQDAQWGPVLTVALGGVWVEVLGDAALRRLPVRTGEVLHMLGELRGAKMLAGQRGIPPANLDRVAEVIEGIATAALSLPLGWHTLEVNPLWVRGDQVEALDALTIWEPSRD